MLSDFEASPLELSTSANKVRPFGPLLCFVRSVIGVCKTTGFVDLHRCVAGVTGINQLSFLSVLLLSSASGLGLAISDVPSVTLLLLDAFNWNSGLLFDRGSGVGGVEASPVFGDSADEGVRCGFTFPLGSSFWSA